MPSTVVTPCAPSMDVAEDVFARILQQACRDANANSALWDIEPAADAGVWWTFVRHRGWPTLAQGWKLHVSATVDSAEAVLRRALPILLASTASFKLAASPRRLRQLNSGGTHPGAVGKFLTVYPPSDAEAVRLAVALDEATQGLKGPQVASDRRLRPDSLVSYRYGGFVRQLMQRPAGAIVSALETPGHELVADERDTGFTLPAWVRDIFVDADVVREPAEQAALIAGRFAPLMRIRNSARGRVDVAVDTVALRSRILKRAYATAEPDRTGQGPRDWLHHEADMLRRLGPSGLAPHLFDMIDDDGDLVLVMEHIQGGTLRDRLSESRADCKPVSHQQVLDWGRQLAHQLRQLHELGLVFRDLKPENVILTPGGRLRLIDFELVTAVNEPGDSYRPGNDRVLFARVAAWPAGGSHRRRVQPGRDAVRSSDRRGTRAGPISAGSPAQSPAAPARPESTRRICQSHRAMHGAGRCPALSLDARGGGRACADLQRTTLQLSGLRKRHRETTPEARARADAAQRARRLGDAMCAAAQPAPATSGFASPCQPAPARLWLCRARRERRHGGHCPGAGRAGDRVRRCAAP